MKINKVAIAIGLTLLVPLSANAGSNGAANGKPFQVLQAQIEENATAIDENGVLIDSNSAGILALSDELGALDLRVGTLETNVSALTAEFTALEGVVAGNTADITLANARIGAVQAELTGLSSNVAANTLAISEAETAIAAAESNIAQLSTNLDTLYALVAVNSADIVTVNSKITDINMSIDDLSYDVVTNAVEIATLNATLTGLTDSLSALEALVATNTATIAQTELDLAEANAKIDTLTTSHNDLIVLVNTNADASDTAIAALKLELEALIANTQTEVDTNTTGLVTLNAALIQLASDNSAIAQSLSAHMLAFSTLADSTTTSIAALSGQIAIINGNLTTLNSTYNSLNSLYNQLSAHVADHHDELDQLAGALSSLSNRVDLIDPDNVDNPNPVAVFTYTDEYSNPDVGNVDNIRTFVANTPTNNRWIHWVANTPAVNRISEFCFKNIDDSILGWGSQNTGSFNTNWQTTPQSESASRSNGGAWIGGQLQFNDYRVDYGNGRYYTYYRLYAQYNSSLQIQLRDYTYNNNNELLDLYHNGDWWTRNTQSTSTFSMTIADDRMSACGY